MARNVLNTARPAKTAFSAGVLTRQGVDWLPHVTGILRDQLPGIEFKVVSPYSPDLADASQSGGIAPRPDVDYQLAAKEPLVAILPSRHIAATLVFCLPHVTQQDAFSSNR